jgi:hypothetical protein
MIFRPTQRLCTKIKAGPLSEAPQHDNPYADWSARLFTVDRAQYVLLTNTPSLYSLLMPGRGITEETTFLDHAIEAMRHYMQDDGLSLIFSNFIVPATGAVSFHKPLSRSVTGSMNEMVFEAKYFMSSGDFSIFDVNERLNETPHASLKFAFAREAFKRLGG